MDPLRHFKECFSNISIFELNERIEFFRNSIQIRSCSEEKLKKELQKIFTSKVDDKEVQFFLNNEIITDPFHKNNFFRIRKFDEKDYVGLKDAVFPSIRIEQDAWWTPPKFIGSHGRLNRPNESVLYVSKELTNSIYETGCVSGECFFLMVYENIKPMRVSQIHNIPYLKGLNELDNAKRIIMHNFLYTEFTKLVAKGREFEYRSTLLIYEEFFKNDKMDAFSYPSIASPYKGGFNMAFPIDKAKANLSLLVVMVCQLGPNSKNSEFMVKPIFDGFWDNAKQAFSFYPYNSVIAREKLGDFIHHRELGL